jgi:N-acyl homoserine lactone hydrolase
LSTALRLRALDAPTLVVRRSSLVLGSADASEIRIPAPAFLIEHRDGLVLFDAGLAPEAVVDPRGEYGERAERLQLHFTADQQVDRQVLAAGYRLSDVTYVVLSHLHFDHAGCAHAFPSAQVVLGDGELAHARSGADKYARSVDVSRVAAGTVVELGEDGDLFGDGSVVALGTPGHTPGHLSVLVRLPDRVYLLTGDALHAREALASETPFPGDHDPAETIRSIRRIKAVADEHRAEIWISHDPADWDRLRPSHLP